MVIWNLLNVVFATKARRHKDYFQTSKLHTSESSELFLGYCSLQT